MLRLLTEISVILLVLLFSPVREFISDHAGFFQIIHTPQSLYDRNRLLFYAFVYLFYSDRIN
jgi:hypothetical protein